MNIRCKLRTRILNLHKNNLCQIQTITTYKNLRVSVGLVYLCQDCLVRLQWVVKSENGVADYTGTSKNLQEPPRTSRNLKEPPRTYRILQKPPGTFRNLQEPSGTSRTLQKHPRTIRTRISRDFQEHPGTSRKIQEHPGTFDNLQEPPGTSRHIQKHPGTSRNLQKGWNISLQSYKWSSKMGFKSLKTV